jgi:hypothetical protein
MTTICSGGQNDVGQAGKPVTLCEIPVLSLILCSASGILPVSRAESGGWNPPLNAYSWDLILKSIGI